MKHQSPQLRCKQFFLFFVKTILIFKEYIFFKTTIIAYMFMIFIITSLVFIIVVYLFIFYEKNNGTCVFFFKNRSGNLKLKFFNKLKIISCGNMYFNHSYFYFMLGFNNLVKLY